METMTRKFTMAEAHARLNEKLADEEHAVRTRQMRKQSSYRAAEVRQLERFLEGK
jgi:hypothetical protein